MQVFAIEPASVRALWVIGLLPLVILGLVICIVGAAALGARGARFEVSSDGLRIRGDWYGRLIPASQLRGDDARRVDFSQSPGLAPVRRTFGTGLPGYQAGWFRLQNGDRALLCLTDRRKAVYVPTTNGYGLLLSPSDPDGFVAALVALPALSRPDAFAPSCRNVRGPWRLPQIRDSDTPAVTK
jgi:hypothetical protein